MTKHRGAPPEIAFVCSNCGAEICYALQRQVSTSHRRGLFGRQTFEMTAQGPPWQAQHAVAGPIAETPSGPLGTGESIYRSLNAASDVSAPMRYALVYAGEVVVLAATIALGAEVNWWITAAGVPAVVVFGLVYFAVTRPIFRNKKTDVNNWLKTRERESETPKETPKPIPYIVEGEIKDGPGRRLYLKFGLDAYESAQAWHKFCRAVMYKDRNFSGREAERNGLSPDDWKRIYRAFVSQGWCTEVNQRGTAQLNGLGRVWVRQYADTPPPEN